MYVSSVTYSPDEIGPETVQYIVLLSVPYRNRDVPETVTLRMIPSREVAEGTLDLFEIFGGELQFENLPTLSRTASPRAHSPRVIAPDEVPTSSTRPAVQQASGPASPPP